MRLSWNGAKQLSGFRDRVLHAKISADMPISRKNRLDIGITILMFIYRTAPLLRPRPPFLRPTSRKKRGGGATTRTCAFASQLKALGQYNYI